MKKEANKIGYIYMITSPTGRIYIGSTSNIENRWKKYRYLSCKGQIKLYNSLRKYGYINHIFEIIWSGSIENMRNYESIIGHWFDVLSEEKGLNLTLPKGDAIYECFSEETKNRISNGNSKKPVLQYDLEGNLVKEWRNCSVASKELNINCAGINNAVRGVTKRAGLFQWRSKEDNVLLKIEKFVFGNSIKILQLSLDNKLIKEWDSLTDIYRIYGKNHITEVLTGSRKTWKRCKWEYKDKIEG